MLAQGLPAAVAPSGKLAALQSRPPTAHHPPTTPPAERSWTSSLVVPVAAASSAAAALGAVTRRGPKPVLHAGSMRSWLRFSRGTSTAQRRQAPVGSSVPKVATTPSPADLGWTDEVLAASPGLREQLEHAIRVGGTNGQALKLSKRWPTQREVFQAIPRDCMKKETWKSLLYTASSLLQVGAMGYLAWRYLPLTLSALPLWIIYAVINGTFGTGLWVIAHECGHNAFSDNKWLQTAVGYVLHTALLVPYFSWQRSHAVHHARTNHLSEGETHVPIVKNEYNGPGPARGLRRLIASCGANVAAVGRMIMHPLIGWPSYLMMGISGGPKYGITNHMWPYRPFNNGEAELFPGKFKLKVLQSDIGLVAMIGLLALWASKAGLMSVLALYLGPLTIVNCWLVIYTLLQHTDVDVPHWDEESWNWSRGAFQTIDRPYGAIIDFLHHRIGSTHVAHHVNCTIPHYKAVRATEALKEKFPDLYLYDPTPLHRALFRVSKNCLSVRKTGGDGMYVYTTA